jgi:adenylate cyclase class IV
MNYEIEIKSLLGLQENADTFRNTILEQGAKKEAENNQLNHYFLMGDAEMLLEKASPYFDEKKFDLLKKILTEGSNHSVRTREIDGVVKLVVKAAVDDTSSENGIARMEFEEDVNLSLDELDQILLDSGFEYQAKWSRKREEYALGDVAISLDKNAGYGYLTEFEMVVPEEGDRHQAEARIRDLMALCGVEELSQDRLSRMFDFYNKNWRDYYGTDKVFTIE